MPTKVKETGGFAFGEFKQVGELARQTGGVTVRDYFATHASEHDIMGMVNGHFEEHHKRKHADPTYTEVYKPLTRHEARYLWADAMLEERMK